MRDSRFAVYLVNGNQGFMLPMHSEAILTSGPVGTVCQRGRADVRCGPQIVAAVEDSRMEIARWAEPIRLRCSEVPLSTSRHRTESSIQLESS